MKKEKIILSFIAVAVGLVIAGGIYYFYQASKSLSGTEKQTVQVNKPTPIPEDDLFLSITEPNNEAVYDKKVIQVSGKTSKDAIVAILTENDQQVIKPTAVGDFSTTITAEDGQNLIKITAVSDSGAQKTIERVITYSTEEF